MKLFMFENDRSNDKAAQKLSDKKFSKIHVFAFYSIEENNYNIIKKINKVEKIKLQHTNF